MTLKCLIGIEPRMKATAWFTAQLNLSMVFIFRQNSQKRLNRSFPWAHSKKYFAESMLQAKADYHHVVVARKYKLSLIHVLLLDDSNTACCNDQQSGSPVLRYSLCFITIIFIYFSSIWCAANFPSLPYFQRPFSTKFPVFSAWQFGRHDAQIL